MNWRQILSWKIMSDEYYDFEELLRNNNIHFKSSNGIITIDHDGYVSLYSLTQLPDNIVFNNKGFVDLYSLKQLPDNIVFINKDSVYLNSLTQLPDNVVFNNKGYVNLYSLTQLPENKDQIFKNDGIVIYNRNEKYDPKIKQLSWKEYVPEITFDLRSKIDGYIMDDGGLDIILDYGKDDLESLGIWRGSDDDYEYYWVPLLTQYYKDVTGKDE